MERRFNFPHIMSVRVKNCEINVYEDVYIKYLQKYAPRKLRDIIMNWQNGADLSNSDYRYIIDNSFSKVHTSNTAISSSDILTGFGIEITHLDSESIEFDIIEDRVNEIELEVFDIVLINMFREGIDLVLEEYFFVPRSISVFRSASDDKEYAIDCACRAAYKFTLVDYLFNQDNSIDFEDFFIDEFSKRIQLIQSIVNNSSSISDIKYLPVYDHFSNYDYNNLANIKSKIKTIICDVNLGIDDRNNIIQNLSMQVYSIDDLNHVDNIKLLDDLFKPLVGPNLELSRAEQLYNTAKTLFELDEDYNSVVDRSFYSSMFAIRCILAYNNLLEDWSPGTMSPNEKHYTLENKLRQFMISQNQIYSDFYNDFKYIKSQRWIADYSLVKTDNTVAQKCITLANQLIQAVASLIS